MNEYLLDVPLPGCATLFLTQGQKTVVHMADLPVLLPYQWRAQWDNRTRRFYVVAWTVRPKRKVLLMHRVILGLSERHILGDHRNGDTLDNRRSNLRAVDGSLNNINGSLRRDNRSGYKGVFWYARHNKWVAYARVQGKRKHLGCFDDRETANQTVQRFYLELYGEAYLQSDYRHNSALCNVTNFPCTLNTTTDGEFTPAAIA